MGTLDQECWKSIHCSDNFKQLDQAINSDVARAFINIPMGKVDQLSWSTRQYWSHLNERLERELCCQFHTSIQFLIQEISWSRKLIKKIASVTGALRTIRFRVRSLYFKDRSATWEHGVATGRAGGIAPLNFKNSLVVFQSDV